MANSQGKARLGKPPSPLREQGELVQVNFRVNRETLKLLRVIARASGKYQSELLHELLLAHPAGNAALEMIRAIPAKEQL